MLAGMFWILWMCSIDENAHEFVESKKETSECFGDLSESKKETSECLEECLMAEQETTECLQDLVQAKYDLLRFEVAQAVEIKDNR